jgi:hypothetical protein
MTLVLVRQTQAHLFRLESSSAPFPVAGPLEPLELGVFQADCLFWNEQLASTLVLLLLCLVELASCLALPLSCASLLVQVLYVLEPIEADLGGWTRE